MKNKLSNSRKFRWLLKSALSTRSLSIDGLGRMHGMTGPSLCIAFYRPFPKAERIIADVLNLEPWDLWPERYSDGKPNRRNRWYDRGRRKNTTENLDVNQKKD
jgi:Ner family transcriptional regulator